ncbi:MAG: type II secretion system minor pseudopilin GspK [Candidatus Hydrogenedentes bacterium]|nr:type II secretion system minor pseudopilin GspK [Candidatus Hydrogenedentota bacterium]
MSAQRHDEREQGVALLLSLLLIVLLSVLVIEFNYETTVEAAHVSANVTQFRARVAAEAAVASGMSLLTADLLSLQQSAEAADDRESEGGAEYDSLDEAWAQGVPYEIINDAVMQCTIQDEFGKINLNALYLHDSDQLNEPLIEAVRALFDLREAPENPVDAILDWIDPDDEEGSSGAETTYYQSLAIPYACKNAPFSSVEELLLVRGITPDVFFGDPALGQLPLGDLLTVHGDPNGRINANTAAYEVLDAVGYVLGQGGLADAVVEEREDGPFVSREELDDRGILPPEDKNNPLPDMLLVRSRCFRIRGHGLYRESKVRIEAYLWRDERQPAEPLRILDWRVFQ